MPVLEVGQAGAGWLVASGHTVWVRGRSLTGHAGKSTRARVPLWRVDHSGVRVISTGAQGANACADVGVGSPIVLGSSATGIYCVTTNTDDQRVIRIDPAGHGSRTVATIPTVQQYDTPDSAVTLDGSYYFLDPPRTVAPGGASAAGPPLSERSPAVIYRINQR